MDELSDKELFTLIGIVRARLRYEAKRKSKVVEGLGDIQQQKVLHLAAIADKLEMELNNR